MSLSSPVSQPLYTDMFLHLWFLLLFCLLILSNVDSMHFVAFHLVHVKRKHLQFKINLC